MYSSKQPSHKINRAKLKTCNTEPCEKMDTDNSGCFSMMQRNKLRAFTRSSSCVAASSFNAYLTQHLVMSEPWNEASEYPREQRLAPRKAPYFADFGPILEILESAEDIVFDTNNQLEPTPLGPAGIQRLVIGNLPLTNLLVSNGGIAKVLHSLLEDGESSSITGTLPPEQCTSFEPSSKRQRHASSRKARGVDEEEDEEDFGEDNSPAGGGRFRRYQSDQWADRFEELGLFREIHGNCLVPHSFPENQQLAQWVKRQRYQYKLKGMNRSSTLIVEREKALEAIGFVWDSHQAAWDERFQSLIEFFSNHGHTNVPSNYENKTLAVWIKCQRRQHKLFMRGGRSTISSERIAMMDLLGFVWNPRNL